MLTKALVLEMLSSLPSSISSFVSDGIISSIPLIFFNFLKSLDSLKPKIYPIIKRGPNGTFTLCPISITFSSSEGTK